MIDIYELKHLINVEAKLYPGGPYDTHLRFGFSEPTPEIEADCQNEFETNFASNFLLESYCWRTFELINQHLRETSGKPTDEFVFLYRNLLNKLLDNIESFDCEIVWRWNSDYSVDYLKKHLGLIIQVPDFKSTSKKKIPNRDYWKIKTMQKSNGKMIYKHIDKDKAESEQEVLFKTNSTFKLISSSGNCIYMEEVLCTSPDIILSQDIWDK